MAWRQSDPFIQDLLLDDFGRRRSRFPWRPLFVCGLIGLAVIAFWQMTSMPEEKPSQNEQKIALEAANSLFHKSLIAARQPLKVSEPPPEPEVEVVKKKTENLISWKEGASISLQGKVQKNESIITAIKKRKVPLANIYPVIEATKSKYDFRRSQPGDQWFADIDDKGKILRFRYQTSPEDIWETRQESGGKFICEKLEVPLDRRTVQIHGVVDGSLWKSLASKGLEERVIDQFSDIFAYSIDLSSEAQTGDHFALIYERVYLNGKFLRPGHIMAALYKNEIDTYVGFYQEEDNNEGSYYDERGQSLQRRFLKSPVTRTRITSRFGKRFHPILKRWKPHNGVDYGGPTGTPVRAMADGVITHAGWKGAMGKMVAIKHDNGFQTYYGHLSAISPRLKRGVKVSKKTFIGRIGSTGRSTGPHLHYGLKKNGKWVDPLKVKFMRDDPLRGADLRVYLKNTVKVYYPQLKALLAKSRPIQ